MFQNTRRRGIAELTDLFMEIFQGSILPNSTIVLLGSVTSMLQQGSSGYLFDWLACAKKIKGKVGKYQSLSATTALGRVPPRQNAPHPS